MAPLIRPYRPQDRAAANLIYYRAIREGTAAVLDEAQRAAWAPTADPDPATPDKLHWALTHPGVQQCQLGGERSGVPSHAIQSAAARPRTSGVVHRAASAR